MADIATGHPPPQDSGPAWAVALKQWNCGGPIRQSNDAFMATKENEQNEHQGEQEAALKTKYAKHATERDKFDDCWFGGLDSFISQNSRHLILATKPNGDCNVKTVEHPDHPDNPDNKKTKNNFGTSDWTVEQ